MALSDILQKIKEEYLEEIKKMEQEFNEKKKKLDAEYEEKQKDIDQDIHNKIEEKSAKILSKAESLATMESKNDLLKSKRKLIELYLDKAIEKLSTSDNYEDILVKLLKKTDIKEENVIIIPPAGKEAKTKDAIKASGKNFFLSEKSEDFSGGFILNAGKFEIDNTFSTIINKQLREDLEMKLNKLLF